MAKIDNVKINVQEKPFKRLEIGTKFSCHAGHFKKVGKRCVFRILEKGNCDTANKLPFTTGNTHCVIL